MTGVAIFKNVALWLGIAILLYFMVEIFDDLKPLEITIGDSNVLLRDVAFVLVSLFIAIRLPIVLKNNKPSD